MREGGREKERERVREKEKGRESVACTGKQKVQVCSKHAGVL